MKLSAKEIFSIPNILSYIRIILIPVFIYLYVTAENITDYYIAAGVILFSGITDFADGLIARKFNMITELGKALDPVADKLTQFVVACTLMYTYRPYIWLVIIILLKDGMLLFGGYYVYHKTGKHLAQAEMPGKIATAVFFVVSILLVAFYIPHTMISSIFIYSTLVLMIIAMIYYGRGLYCLYHEDESV